MTSVDHPNHSGGFVTIHQSSFASLRANRRYRRELADAFAREEDLVFAKDMRAFASRGGFGVGLGDPRRAVTLCGWRHAASAKDFFNDSSGRDWTALLEVTRTRGDHFGAKPLVETAQTDDAGPIAVLTLGATPWRGLIRFMFHGARLRQSLEGSPGLLFATSTGWPTTGNSTFSLWKSEAAMLAFAYGDGGHKATAHARSPVLSGQLNARMRVLEVSGVLAEIPELSRSAGSATPR